MAKTLTERTLVIAHRGASAYAPENTMPAYELAAKMKADGIETDVHFTADGKIVTLHDEKIDRTSNGQGLVTDYTYEELLHFDFGRKFSPDFKGTKLPLMEDLFNLCRENNMVCNVEIKSADPKMPAALHALAEKTGMLDLVIYSSFDHEQLARMLEVNPKAFVAPLYSFNMVKAWDYSENLGALASHPKYTQIKLYADYVEKCHEKGIRVHPWTVDDPEIATFLAEAGCDAVITNKPDLIREVYGLTD